MTGEVLTPLRPREFFARPWSGRGEFVTTLLPGRLLSRRFRFRSDVAGDARTSDLGCAHDVVTLLQVLHNVDRAASVQLLRAAAGGVRPGGLFVVLEIEAASTLMGSLASLAFTGWMGSRTWTAQQLTEMAADAGVCDVRAQRPAKLPGSVLLLGNTPPATA